MILDRSEANPRLQVIQNGVDLFVRRRDNLGPELLQQGVARLVEAGQVGRTTDRIVLSGIVGDPVGAGQILKPNRRLLGGVGEDGADPADRFLVGRRSGRRGCVAIHGFVFPFLAWRGRPANKNFLFSPQPNERRRAGDRGSVGRSARDLEIDTLLILADGDQDSRQGRPDQVIRQFAE